MTRVHAAPARNISSAAVSRAQTEALPAEVV